MTTWSSDDTELFMRYGDAFVPRRAEQISVVCSLLGASPGPAILELACGSGTLTAELLWRHPSVTVTAVDASEAMLIAAAKRLAPFGDRVKLVEADLADAGWRTGTYGAVVTSLAVHHLADSGKQRLMRAVYKRLEPGGVYVQADLARPATRVTTALAAEQWESAVEQQSTALLGSREAQKAFQQTRWNTFQHPDPVDQPALVTDQLRWLAEAGFVAMDLPWAFAGHVILTATKPVQRRSG